MLRDNQKYPSGNWRIWLILAGRGFGKTTAGAYNINLLIQNKMIKSLALIANTIFEARHIMLEKIIEFNNNEYGTSTRYIQILETKIYLFNGSYFDSLRGYSFDFVWIDELVKFKNTEALLQQVYLSLRIGISRIIITTTPKDIPTINKLKASDAVFLTEGSSYQNEQLSSNFKQNIANFENTQFGQQEIYGKTISETLWNRSDIVYQKPKKIIKYRIGIDPAVATGVTGIILIGIDEQRNYYILGDYSTRATPDIWIYIIKQIIDSYTPIEIAIEINQGGNLIKTLMKLYNISCNILEVRAISSKSNRRIPTYLLYKQKRIFHTEIFNDLEKELLECPADRIDALNWALQNTDPVYSAFDFFYI